MPYLTKEARLFVITQLVLLVVGLIVLSWYFNSKEEMLTVGLERSIEEQRRELLVLIDLSSKNILDEKTADILRDCSVRSEFDQLLRTLDTLGYSDLLRASQHFDLCGEYFFVKKSVISLRLERELELLEDYVGSREAIEGNSAEHDRLIAVWSDIADLENSRSQNLRTQAGIQGEIIQKLLEGDRSAVSASAGRGVDLAELLAVQANQLETLRAEEQRVWEALLSS